MLTHDELEEYRLLAEQVKLLKKKEVEMRRYICDQLLDGRNIGTHNFSMEGFAIKAKKAVAYKFDQEVVQHLIEEDELNDYEREMIRTKYEVALANFKKGADELESLEDAVIVTPSMPTLDRKSVV